MIVLRDDNKPSRRRSATPDGAIPDNITHSKLIDTGRWIRDHYLTSQFIRFPFTHAYFDHFENYRFRRLVGDKKSKCAVFFILISSRNFTHSVELHDCILLLRLMETIAAVCAH